MSLRTTSSQVSAGETRIVVQTASWQLYRSFVEHLPESSHVHAAFDGRRMEIMTGGPLHGHYAELAGQFVAAVGGACGVRLLPMGGTTWTRPEIERGIEADESYYFVPEKIATALGLLTRRRNDVADYPIPDLLVDVELSASQIDRLGIFAALGVAEVWVFDGERVTIRRLTEEGRYTAVEGSGFLPIRAEHVGPWLLEENLLDLDAWRQRVRAWAANLQNAK